MKRIFKHWLLCLLASLVLLPSCDINEDIADDNLAVFDLIIRRDEASANFEFKGVMNNGSIAWTKGDAVTFVMKVSSIDWETLEAFLVQPGGLLPATVHDTIEGKFVYEKRTWVTYLKQEDSSFAKQEQITVDCPESEGSCFIETHYTFRNNVPEGPNSLRVDWSADYPFAVGSQTITIQLP